MIWKLAILRWILQEFDQSNNVEDIGVCHTKDEVDSNLNQITWLIWVQHIREECWCEQVLGTHTNVGVDLIW